MQQLKESETGFTITDIETFTKTHDFADWTARSRTSEDDIAELARMLLNAPLRWRKLLWAVALTLGADGSLVMHGEQVYPIEGVAVIMAVYLTISLSISALMNWYNARIALR